MRIAIFGKQSFDFIAAIAQGFAALGLKPELRHPGYSEGQPENGFDMIVVHGLHGETQNIFNRYSAAGVPGLVLDLGFIYRPDYFQLGWGGLNWIPAFDCEPARAQAMFGDIPTEPKRGGQYVLVCCQKHGDKQHNLRSVRVWADETIKKIKLFTDKPIRFRPHPLYNFNPGIAGVEYSNPDEVSFSSDIENACCMVTYNSTAAYQAILSGVQVFCDPSAVYAPICNTDLSEIDRPVFKPLKSFFNRLAYGQWTMAEMASGEALQFLLNAQFGHEMPVAPAVVEKEIEAEPPAQKIIEQPARIKRKYTKKKGKK